MGVNDCGEWRLCKAQNKQRESHTCILLDPVSALYSIMCFLPVAHTLSTAQADRAVLDDEVALFKCEAVCASITSVWLGYLPYPFSVPGSGLSLPCFIREPFIGLSFMCKWNYICIFFGYCRGYSDRWNISIHQRDGVSIYVDTVYQHDIYFFVFFFLPFFLCILYHLDWVPDQDSGAGTWPWVYLSCAKSWSSSDLPYRQLHQKGVDRMCSCCHRKSKTTFLVTPWCLSTKLPLKSTSETGLRKLFLLTLRCSTVVSELPKGLFFHTFSVHVMN